MPTLDEITKSGYSASTNSGFGQFLQGVNQFAQESIQAKETKAKADKEKTDFYSSLRQAGYSEDQAKQKIDKVYSGNFLQKMMGKDNAFQAPETDVYSGQQKESRLKLEKMQEETNLLKSKQKYYNEGGPRRASVDGMNSNQLQTRLKNLQKIYESAFDDEDMQAELKSEMDHVNERIKQLEGYKGPSSADPEKVLMKRPDGATVRIKTADLDAATKAGYKKVGNA